jgi:hypothetical protein
MQRPLPDKTKHPHKTEIRVTAGFQPTIPPSEQQQNIDSAATVIGDNNNNNNNNNNKDVHSSTWLLSQVNVHTVHYQTYWKRATICTDLYHSFIRCIGSYMFRQHPAMIRELLRSFWGTWNTNRMSGIAYNVWLLDLCAVFAVVPLICVPYLPWFRWSVCRICHGSVDLCAGLPWFRRNHGNPAHSSSNHTLYAISPIRFVFQVTQKDLRSSLMMAGYCRNMYEPIHWIKNLNRSVHIVGVFSNTYCCHRFAFR